VEGNEEVVAFVQLLKGSDVTTQDQLPYQPAAHILQEAFGNHPDGRLACDIDGQAPETQTGGVVTPLTQAISHQPLTPEKTFAKEKQDGGGDRRRRLHRRRDRQEICL
jgi:hypothetical protein